MARVLLVDDEPVVRRVLTKILARRGHDVVEAIDVAQAVALYQDEAGDAPRIAIVDKNLPDGSGLDVVRAIRARDPRAAAIIITGYASEGAAREALDVGAFDFLRKPLADVDDLVRAVARAEQAMEAGGVERPVGTGAGPVVVCDPGGRGDLLVAALAQAGRQVVRIAPGEARARLAGTGARAVVIAGEARSLVSEVLAGARAAQPSPPVTVIAERGALDEILVALRGGAVAYLVDPSIEEIARRLA